MLALSFSKHLYVVNMYEVMWSCLTMVMLTLNFCLIILPLGIYLQNSIHIGDYYYMILPTKYRGRKAILSQCLKLHFIGIFVQLT